MQDKTIRWQSHNDNVAPLTALQQDALYEISQKFNESCSAKTNTKNTNETQNSNNQQPFNLNRIETSQDFFQWYAKIEEDLEKEHNVDSKKYYERLATQRNHSLKLIEDVDSALQEMSNLSIAYDDVLAKTNSLNEISEQLLVDQTNLQKTSEEISKKLQYFTSLTQLSQMLALPALSVSNNSFFEMMEKIDSCMEYLTVNVKLVIIEYCTLF